MSKLPMQELEKYREKLSRLDAAAEKLDRDKRLRYQKSKTLFINRLDVWQNAIETDMEILKKNVAEGYHELESKVLQ